MNDVMTNTKPAVPTATTPGMKGADKLTALASRSSAAKLCSSAAQSSAWNECLISSSVGSTMTSQRASVRRSSSLT